LLINGLTFTWTRSTIETGKLDDALFKANLIVVVLCLVIALFLTIYRRGSNGGLGIIVHRHLRAAAERTDDSYDLTALRVFTVVLGRIKDHYVEPERISR
jgi:hypothetical protein